MSNKSKKSCCGATDLSLTPDELRSASLFASCVLASARKFGLRRRQLLAGLLCALFDVSKVDSRYFFSFAESDDFCVVGAVRFNRYPIYKPGSTCADLSDPDSDKLPF